jgi:hypothetical protein
VERVGQNVRVKVIEYGLAKGTEEQSFLDVSAKLTPELAATVVHQAGATQRRNWKMA